MRGETGRVAARVRQLLETGGAVDTAEPARRAVPVAPGPDSAPVAPGPTTSGWARLAAALGGKFPRPWRLDPGRRTAMTVALGVLVAAVATGAWVVAERPRAVPVATNSAAPVESPRTVTSTAAGTAPSADAGAASLRSPVRSAPAATASEVVVDVAGKVRRPGVYRLPSGARIDDAVRAAGGALTGVNLASLNLAAKVQDGQQIRVGLPGDTVPSPSADAASVGNAATQGPVDLNTAASDQLQTLPGVGPVLAQHILDWRAAHGRFDTVDQLNDVPGIGEVKFASLRSRVTV